MLRASDNPATRSNGANGKERFRGSFARLGSEVSARRRPLVWGALVAFFLLYYYRPEDVIMALAYIPMAKIAAVVAFIPILLERLGGGREKVATAIKILWILLVQMTLCIPFAIWRGGAYHTVFDKFAKGVVIAMVISIVVVSVKQLKRLLWIQASAVALVTFASIAMRHYDPSDGRLSGVQLGILQNPNDLAINIAISFPLAMAFMLNARGLKKAIWSLALGFMALGVILTSSRSGLLAMLLCLGICIWEYGIKGKRQQLIIAMILSGVLGMGVAMSSTHYRARVASIALGDVEGAGDKGSMAARKELLKKSLLVALHRPIFGVGPGCFPLIDEGWRVAHNAYTELAAEGGFPALFLFLLAFWAAFRNIAQVRKSARYREDKEFQVFTQALWAGLVAYLAGSLFASTEYSLYPYFMVAYTCVVQRIASQSQGGEERIAKPRSWTKVNYDGVPDTQTLRTR
jgi:putative inorganic carbon (hco3(-)) transporter